MYKDEMRSESKLYSVLGRLGSTFITDLPAAIRDGIADLQSRLRGSEAAAAAASDFEAEQEQWHQLGDPPVMQPRLRPGTRLLAGAGGGVLLLWGLRRKPIRGVQIVGAGLLLSALLNRPVWQVLGIGAGRRVVDLSKTLDVAAPIDEVFEFWRNFQNFPLFMQHVREITVLDETQSHWTVSGPAGIPVEWDAVLTVCIPRQRLGWKSLPDQPIEHAGTVGFEELADGKTRLTVQMAYKPPAGILGHAVAALFQADPQTALDHDLLRFKKRIEADQQGSRDR